jgi:hypothetical protein
MRLNMATREQRLEDFTVDENPPEGTLARILCEDHRGTYAIPFPCRRSDSGWVNEKTGELIDAEVIGWREWTSAR